MERIIPLKVSNSSPSLKYNFRTVPILRLFFFSIKIDKWTQINVAVQRMSCQVTNEEEGERGMHENKQYGSRVDEKRKNIMETMYKTHL